jgi:hypothetical protein
MTGSGRKSVLVLCADRDAQVAGSFWHLVARLMASLLLYFFISTFFDLTNASLLGPIFDR